nr:uncharacterized mitochondrial protein AtMg00810-like [Nicotiana tomentosiformis]
MRSKEGVLLNQRKYALELISDAGLSGCKPVATPMELNHKLTTVDYDNHVDGIDDAQLEEVLSQFMQQPKRSHMDAALRVVKYIKGAPGLRILLKKGETQTLTGFCDSDWASCPNTRRSVIGYVIKLGESLLSWKSKKQQTVSRSRVQEHGSCSSGDHLDGWFTGGPWKQSTDTSEFAL